MAIISCKQASMAAMTAIGHRVMAAMPIVSWRAAEINASIKAKLATTATPIPAMAATPNVVEKFVETLVLTPVKPVTTATVTRATPVPTAATSPLAVMVFAAEI